MYGSDHRPVALSLTVQGFFDTGTFCEVDKLLDMNNPEQGYGEFDVELLDLSGLNFTLIK